MKNRLFQILFLISFTLCFQTPVKAQIKRAQKLLQQKQFDKLRSVLNKSIEKDSVNAPARYLWSVLWTSESNPMANIDSAYQSILIAQADFSLTDQKRKNQLLKLGIDNSRITEQLELVESLAYTRSSKENSIEGFDFFIKNYTTANQITNAIDSRDNLAFEKAKSTHTYESYKFFIDTYPNAEQIGQAKELFDITLFQEKTKNGKLQDYKLFLIQNPENPYLHIAEKKIYEFMTAGNSILDYEQFLAEYPNGYMKKSASDFLYHKYILENKPFMFLRDYPSLSSDSVRQVILLEGTKHIPFLDLNGFGFMDLSGEIITQALYKNIEKKELCQISDADYFMAKIDSRRAIIGLNGAVIYQNEFDSVQDLGSGILSIKSTNKLKLVQKGGHVILEGIFQQAKIINNSFLACQKNDKWGLYTFSGQQLLQHDYDEINRQGPLYVFIKNNKLALATNYQLSIGLESPIKLNHIYDDIESLDNGLFVLVQGSNESMINTELSTIIEQAVQSIRPIEGGYLIKSMSGIEVHSIHYPNLKSMKFNDIIHKPQGLAIRKGDKWAYLQNGKTQPEFLYDSITFVGDSFVLLQQKDQRWFIFERSKKELHVENAYKLLRSISTRTEYLQFVTKNNTLDLFNVKGKLILKGKFNAINPLGSEYLAVESNGKRGLYSSEGKQLLSFKYDAIGNYSNGFISLLQDGKFGIFNKSGEVSIKPLYDKPIQALTKKIFLVALNGKVGLVDNLRTEILPIEYDEILLWNKNSVLIRKNFQWTIIDAITQSVIADRIKSFSYIKKDSSEMIIKTHKDEGFGLLSNVKGPIVPSTYTDIINLGSNSDPLYFCEKQIEEASFYVVIYMNKEGEIIRKQAFEEEEYGKILCDD